MSTALVLVNCDLGTEDALIKGLSKMSGVSFAYKTQGVYDMIVRLDLGSTDALRKAIQQVRKFDNVRSSLTMIVKEDEEED